MDTLDWSELKKKKPTEQHSLLKDALADIDEGLERLRGYDVIGENDNNRI